MNVFNLPGPQFLRFYFLLTGACVVIGMALRWRFRYPFDALDGAPAELDATEAAYLAGAARGVVDSAIASLLHRGGLRVETGRAPRIKATYTELPDATEVEGAVLDSALSHNERGASLTEIRTEVGPLAEGYGERLSEAGLVLPSDRLNIVRTVPFMLMFACVAVGVIKINIGISRNRPVSFLVILCIATAVIGAVMLVKSPHRTRRGDKRLARLRKENAALEVSSVKRMAPPDLMMAMALFGPAVLAIEHVDLYRMFRPPSNGGSCGGSCGGGGCGGGGCGGGGCGGCGSS